MRTRASIFVTLPFTSFHRWPEAPDSVAFLRSLHRHVFGVRVEVIVSHNDRQVEFFMLQSFVGSVISSHLMPALSENRAMSCEMMAAFILEKLQPDYTVLSVTVDEDGENGATVTLLD